VAKLDEIGRSEKKPATCQSWLSSADISRVELVSSVASALFDPPHFHQKTRIVVRVFCYTFFPVAHLLPKKSLDEAYRGVYEHRISSKTVGQGKEVRGIRKHQNHAQAAGLTRG
jgi:hypothetical protein